MITLEDLRRAAFFTFRLGNQPDFVMKISSSRVRTLHTGAGICISGWAKLQVRDMVYELQAGDFMTITLSSMVQLLEASDDFDGYLVVCSSKELVQIARYHAQIFRFFEQEVQVPLEKEEEHSLKLLCQTLEQYTKLPQHPFYREAHFHLGRVFLIECLAIHDRMLKEANKNLNRKQQHYLAFIQLVKERYTTYRTVEYYAQELNISATYLNNVCHTIAGVSTLQCINDYTIKQIYVALMYTDMTVQQIAEELAFTSSSALIRFFRRFEDCTPQQWRKKKFRLH